MLHQRPDPPVNIVGGYKFPSAPAIDLNSSDVKPVSAPLAAALLLINDSLDIPDFLRRAYAMIAARSGVFQTTCAVDARPVANLIQQKERIIGQVVEKYMRRNPSRAQNVVGSSFSKARPPPTSK